MAPLDVEATEPDPGKVAARYPWNPEVVGEGATFAAAVEDLKRTHLSIGNRADGRWAGSTLTPEEPPMAAKTKPNPAVTTATSPKAEDVDGGPPPADAVACVPAAPKKAPKRAAPKAKPGERPRARDGRPKAGDGLPTDLVGGLFAEGSIVAVPVAVPGGEEGGDVVLRLGYVKKLGKSFIDVVTFVTDQEQVPFRCTDPRNELVVVDPERLDSRVPLYEAVKFAAATTRKY